MNSILEKPLKCLHKPTNIIYDVIVLVKDKGIVKVKSANINRNGDTVDTILDHLPFDECEILLYTGKYDDENREILEGDIVSYGYKFQYKGYVKWNDEQSAWLVIETDDPGQRVFKLSEVDSQYCHVVGNKYGRFV